MARKCRICRQPYVPLRAMQPTCLSFDCQLAYASRIAKRSAAKRMAAERQVLRKRKEQAKRPSMLASEAQVAVNELARFRDRDDPCISCGRYSLSDPLTGGSFDAGHYRSRGAAIHLRFNLDNIHKQCKRCNRQLGGNVVEFRKGLIAKIGLTRVEAIESDNTPRRFRADDYRAIRDDARAKLKEMKRESGL